MGLHFNCQTNCPPVRLGNFSDYWDLSQEFTKNCRCEMHGTETGLSQDTQGPSGIPLLGNGQEPCCRKEPSGCPLKKLADPGDWNSYLNSLAWTVDRHSSQNQAICRRIRTSPQAFWDTRKARLPGEHANHCGCEQPDCPAQASCSPSLWSGRMGGQLRAQLLGPLLLELLFVNQHIGLYYNSLPSGYPRDQSCFFCELMMPFSHQIHSTFYLAFVHLIHIYIYKKSVHGKKYKISISL